MNRDHVVYLLGWFVVFFLLYMVMVYKATRGMSWKNVGMAVLGAAVMTLMLSMVR